MSEHWTAEDIERFADGEGGGDDSHLRECGQCASAVLDTLRMKSAVRAAMRVEPAPASLRRRLSPHTHLWIPAVAAVLAVIVVGSLLLFRHDNPGTEFADMHTTILASSNPVEVISTDRHTVKPWFEGKVPFTVPIPTVAPPYRLIGGRVVFWRGNPVAYLLFGKDAHRISVFVMRNVPMRMVSAAGHSLISWNSNGLTFVAVGEVPREDLQQLRSLFTNIDASGSVH